MICTIIPNGSTVVLRTESAFFILLVSNFKSLALMLLPQQTMAEESTLHNAAKNEGSKLPQKEQSAVPSCI